MDEDVGWIARDSGRLPSSVLDCIAAASVKTSYYVYFRDPLEQKAYDPRYWRLSHKTETANAREWLGTRNLLATVPRPAKGEPLSDYAEAVEVFCGVKKHTMLVARDEHTMTFAAGGLGKLTANGVENSAATNDQFECVMNATSAVDLNSQGIFFGFIGNEAKKP